MWSLLRKRGKEYLWKETGYYTLERPKFIDFRLRFNVSSCGNTERSFFLTSRHRCTEVETYSLISRKGRNTREETGPYTWVFTCTTFVHPTDSVQVWGDEHRLSYPRQIPEFVQTLLFSFLFYVSSLKRWGPINLWISTGRGWRLFNDKDVSGQV